jgi:transcription antitermination protein NusB
MNEQSIENNPTKIPNPSIKRKHVARIIAVQFVYARLLNQHVTIDELLNWYAELPVELAVIVSKFDKKLLESLLFGASEMQGAITDKLLELLAERWQTKRMPYVMRAILICATYEIIYMPKLANGIIIDEYVGVADAFLDDKDIGFVNGVLQELIKKLRP